MAKATPIASCKKEISIKIEPMDSKLESPDSCLYPLETYKCNTCRFQTNFLRHLRSHLVVHTPRPKQKCKFLSYVCQKCNFSTHSILVLSKHVSDLCSNLRWYSCERCSFKTHRSDYLRRHEKNKHTPAKDVRWFQCKFCPHRTRWKGNLKEHVSTIHSKPPLKVYKCGICDFKTVWKNALKRHKLKKHSHNTKPVWLKCAHCDYSTLRKDSLKRHCASLHANDEQAPRFRCKICYFETRRRDLLKRHTEQVHGILLKPKPKSPNKTKLEPPKFTLNDLGLRFEVVPNAEASFVAIQPNSHVIEALPQERWFSCDRCPFSAKLQSSLKIHKLSHQRSSTKTVYFKCGLCPLQSDRKDNLQRHIRETHIEWAVQGGPFVTTGVLDKAKYRCDLCPFSTEWTNSLNMHKKMTHRESAPR